MLSWNHNHSSLSPVTRTIRIPPAAAGERLDRFLVTASPDLSRARLQAWIREGHVHVNGAPAKPSQVLHGGEVVTMRPPDIQPTQLLAENIPLDILYEDHDIVVVNKPAGLAMHPGAGRQTGTLVNALLGQIEGLSGIGGVERPGIVHRLDIDTTGLVIIAKHDQAHQALAKQFHDRQVEKKYLALCYGLLKPKGSVDLPIGRHPSHRQAMSTHSRQGRDALTYWETRETFGKELSFIEVRIATGRTHQIRVHMSAIGHPLVGDPLYGGRKTIKRLPKAWQEQVSAFVRPALHAWQLQVHHPITGALCAWTAPIPEDLQQLLEGLRDAARS